jgi:LysM repeat protein
MKGYPDLQINEARSDDMTNSPDQRRTGSGKTKTRSILLVVLLVLLFVVGIAFSISTLRTIDKVSPLEVKMAALEQKIAGIERQLAEVQGRFSASNPDPAFVQRVDPLVQRVEEPKKQKRSRAEPKAKAPVPLKPDDSIEGEHHMIQEGDNLGRISKKYGISVETLRELNNLSEDQPIRAGQRLLISPQPKP